MENPSSCLNISVSYVNESLVIRMYLAMFYATLLCGLGVLWLYFRYRRMTLLKRSNIPGPPAHFLFGNSAEFKEKGMKRCFQEWTDRYGPVVGFYLGGNPSVLVTDLDLLRKVQIKDFHLFNSRYTFIKGCHQPH
ncbi:Cytochrome P450 6a8 [Halotydeus destructor]|nr:Cytochrome P450 6a8 [Halotydeus destructor]